MGRKQFTTLDPSVFATHDHVAWSGDGPDGLDRLAVAAFTAATGRGEQMVFIAEDPQATRLAALQDVDGLLAHGQLQLSTIEETYATVPDPEDRLAFFADQIDRSLAEGYSGMCVVADNSSFALGSDEEFGDWLGWEARTDVLQAVAPLNGVCYFDRQLVPTERLTDVAALHPVLSAAFESPGFRIFVDDERVVRVVGSLDTFCVERLQRILTSAPTLVERVFDLSGVEFINHRALLSLNQLAASGLPVRIQNAPEIAARIWDILKLPSPALEFVE